MLSACHYREKAPLSAPITMMPPNPYLNRIGIEPATMMVLPSSLVDVRMSDSSLVTRLPDCYDTAVPSSNEERRAGACAGARSGGGIRIAAVALLVALGAGTGPGGRVTAAGLY